MTSSELRAFDHAFRALADGDLGAAAEFTASVTPGVDMPDRDELSLRTRLICASARLDYLDHLINSSCEGLASFLSSGVRSPAPRAPVWAAHVLSRAVLNTAEHSQEGDRIAPLLKIWSALLELRDEVSGTRDAARGVIGPGWSTCVANGDFVNECSNDGLIALVFALGALAAQNRQSSMTADVRATVGSFLPLAQQLCRFYLPEVERDDAGHYFMRSRIDGRVEPYNHVHSWAAACGIIGRLLDDGELEEVAAGFLGTFQSLTIPDPETGLPYWSYRPPVCGEPPARGEQIWKAIHTLTLPLCMQKIDCSLRTHIAETYVPIFLRRIYTGCHRRSGLPTFQIFIGNAKRRPLERRRIRNPKRRGSVTALAEWTVLGQIAPEIDEIVLDAVIRRPDIFPNGWRSGVAPLVALAEIVLRRPDLPGRYLETAMARSADKPAGSAGAMTRSIA